MRVNFVYQISSASVMFYQLLVAIAPEHQSGKDSGHYINPQDLLPSRHCQQVAIFTPPTVVGRGSEEPQHSWL